MINDNAGLAWLAVVIVLGVSLFLYLAARSGRGYSAEQTKSDAESFAGAVEEGRGGMTAFLWVFCACVFVWTVAYFILHWGEFTSTFFGK